MPIRPENRARYPANWREISDRIRFERAGGRCECTGQCGQDHTSRCAAEHGDPHPDTGSKVILTVMHLDHQPEHNDDTNLLAGCRCTTAAPPLIEKHGPHAEYICAKHWRAVPEFDRRHLAKARRYLRRRHSETIARLADRAWARCKAEAIAAATGSITDASLSAFLETL